MIRHPTNNRLPGVVLVRCSPSCHIDSKTRLRPSFGSATFFAVSPAAVCGGGGEVCALPQTSSLRPRQPNSFLARVYITGSVCHVSQNFAVVEADLHGYSSREAPPEESQQLGGPTFNPPDSQAHPGSQWDRPLPRCDQSPTSLIEDVHLANIIPANRHDTTTTAKSTEPTCDVRRPCPPITESVMQVMTEEVSPVCEPQRYFVAQLPLNQ